MARKGRDLEKLVASLEESLAPKGAIIKSPEFFDDLDTGSKREVDISIKYKVGSVPILITVECRDRNNKDDSTWIEQLDSKRKSIGATKTVAVSAAGFSQPALIKAKRLGIETRTLKKIKPRDFEEIFKNLLFSMYYKKLTLTGGNIEFYYDGKKSVTDVKLVDITEDDDFLLFQAFKATGPNLVLSLMDVSKEAIEKDIIQHIEDKKFNEIIEHHCKFEFENGQLTANTNYGVLSVKLVILKYDVIIEELRLDPTELIKYQDGDNTIIEKFKLETKVGNLPINITVNKKSD